MKSLTNKDMDNMTKKISIAIDGPAGAGKSTIAKAAAKKLGYLYIDTGAMYRAIGVAVTGSGYDPKCADDVIKVLDGIRMDIIAKEDGQHILLGGEDVNGKIRTPEASMAASAVATIPQVRYKLVEIQRGLAKQGGIIMDGRDIGTYVLPDAEVKIFLTASVETRAKRRYKELIEKGENCTLAEVVSDIEARDKQDSEREFAPLKMAEDSVLLDTSDKTLEQSVQALINIIREKI